MVKSNLKINKRRESLIQKREELGSYLRYAAEMLKNAKNVMSYCASIEFLDSLERSLDKVGVAVNKYIDEAVVHSNKCKDLTLQSELSSEDSVLQIGDNNDKDEAGS